MQWPPNKQTNKHTCRARGLATAEMVNLLPRPQVVVFDTLRISEMRVQVLQVHVRVILFGPKAHQALLVQECTL